MKRNFILGLLIVLISTGCTQEKFKINSLDLNNQIKDNSSEPQITLDKSNFKVHSSTNSKDEQLRQSLITKYQYPKEWGENVTGVKTRLDTTENVIALTLDACGGATGSQYDAELIYFLRQHQIPATLFINNRWIDSNYWTFVALSKIPLFQIENHGTLHRPLSISGREAWGIKGTQNVGEIVDEVLLNHRRIENITGRAPNYFRSGTAFYDEVAVQITNDLNEQVVNFNVLGDAGATFNQYQVRDALLNAKPGSIVLLHMNKPASETFEGIRLAIPELKRRGVRFVKLDEFPLK
jgi:peptidoglycan/xylan/chitin deacetylase (PgdA/CDA1 family)